ncbi:MAG: hypothetical protein K0R08_579 [Solimicrobium sp.]|jgi:hypothetical protein|nr:hypothetical protein [Solimicrobium sp.]
MTLRGLIGMPVDGQICSRNYNDSFQSIGYLVEVLLDLHSDNSIAGELRNKVLKVVVASKHRARTHCFHTVNPSPTMKQRSKIRILVSDKRVKTPFCTPKNLYFQKYNEKNAE